MKRLLLAKADLKVGLYAALVVAASAFVAAQSGLDPASIIKPLGESWPTYSGDYTGRRYSSLTQINQSNVKTHDARLDAASREWSRAGGGHALGPARRT